MTIQQKINYKISFHKHVVTGLSDSFSADTININLSILLEELQCTGNYINEVLTEITEYLNNSIPICEIQTVSTNCISTDGVNADFYENFEYNGQYVPPVYSIPLLDLYDIILAWKNFINY